MTTLLEIYNQIDYSNSRPTVRDILEDLQLLNFKRNRDGKIQSFHFHFSYKGKEYTLQHYFLFHWQGIDNWFKLKKPSLFSLLPFRLENNDLCKLSEELMRAVNKWNQTQPKIS